MMVVGYNEIPTLDRYIIDRTNCLRTWIYA